MFGIAAVDPFATKGIEYLLVVGFLMVLILFWRVLNRPMLAVGRPAARAGVGRWFRYPGDVYYHPGHSWARPEGDDVFVVGIDDFAQKLLGRASAVALPAIGERVEQGARAVKLDVASRWIDMLSPVDGEVVARNDAVLNAPTLVNDDPYGQGWLVKIRSPRLKSNLNNLLHGALARAWVRTTEASLRRRLAGELGAVMQDGGEPVSGIARVLSPEEWEDIARDFLMTR